MVTPHNKKNNLILANELLYRGRKAQDFYEKLYYYNTALKINPYNIYAWNSKGNVLFSLGRFQEAMECYNKAIELNFKFSKAGSGKGNTLRKLGNPSEAIRCYDKSISFFMKTHMSGIARVTLLETLATILTQLNVMTGQLS